MARVAVRPRRTGATVARATFGHAVFDGAGFGQPQRVEGDPPGGVLSGQPYGWCVAEGVGVAGEFAVRGGPSSAVFPVLTAEDVGRDGAERFECPLRRVLRHAGTDRPRITPM